MFEKLNDVVQRYEEMAELMARPETAADYARLSQLGKELPKRAIPAAMALGYVIGIMAVWLYASMRAHYGPGPNTAVIAAVMTWMLGYALPHYSFWAAGIFSGSLMALASAIGLAELILATLAGAWIYKPAGEVVAPEPSVSA